MGPEVFITIPCNPDITQGCFFIFILLKYLTMGINIKKKYYIIPIIYIGIISLLVYMQFSTTSDFSDNISTIQITGETRSNSDDRATAVTSLDIDIHGFIIPLSSKSPVIMTTLDGNKTRLFIKGYNKTGNELELFFSGDVKIRIEDRKAETRGFCIIPVFPAGNSNIESVSVPYKLVNPEDLTPTEIFPVFSFSEGENLFFAAATPKSVIDIKKNIITAVPDSDQNIRISIREASEGLSDPYSFWFSAFMIDTERTAEEETLIAEYIDKGYSGWKATRFNQKTGKWKTHDGAEVYNTEIISALASESFRRNEFRRNRWLFNASRVLNKEVFFLEAALANGNLVKTYEEFQKNDIELINKISEMIKQQNADVFKIKDLIKIIVDRGPYSLNQELFQMAERSYKTEDRDIRLGIATAYLDFASLNIEPELSLNRFNNIVDNLVIRNIVKADEGLFISDPDDNGSADTFFTLKAADCLIKSEKFNTRPVISTIGKKLITSLLPYSNSEGFLPEKIIIKNSKVSNTTGYMEPEKAYMYLGSYRYMPRIISLKNELNPGAWIATCSENVDIKKMPGEIRISTSFPANSIEYIVIQGVPEVKGFSLYGKDWVSDPSFERYSAGWVYQKETNSVFIKLQHKQETEEITIKY